jgi:hypothetical protein
MSAEQDRKDQPEVAIERERQKTKRYLMFLLVFAAIVIIAIIAVFRGGRDSAGTQSFELELGGAKVRMSSDRPILQQAGQPEISYATPRGTVEYTAGKIDASVLDDIDDFDPEMVEPTQFVGENFINTQAGFVLTVRNPHQWEVMYNPAGLMNPLMPINTIVTGDGSHLNITREVQAADIDIEAYALLSVQGLIDEGLIAQFPDISYDYGSQTAFLYFANPYTGGESFMKMILGGRYAYLATANYNPYVSNPQRIDDLIQMVTSFTLLTG